MFIGHFGAGLAAKKIDSGLSLGTLFLAAQFIDLLWPLFLILGIEQVKIDPGNTPFTPLDFIYYPFSHSFLGVLIWSLLFGSVYYFIKKKIKGALLLGSLVMSHWVLDLVTHRPDLPLTFSGGEKVGLGLWYSVPSTLIFEALIFIAGIYFYLKAVKGRNKKGRIIFWSLIIFLGIIYFVNAFGSAPPSEDAIAFAGLSLWLLVAWGYWADRNNRAFNQHEKIS